jgi:SAM-dependent methyltransferase
MSGRPSARSQRSPKIPASTTVTTDDQEKQENGQEKQERGSHMADVNAGAAPPIDRGAAAAWISRWDAQQQVSMPDREERFTALIDAVEAAADRPDPLIIDLGCGPGSLAVRLLGRLPGATVVAVDADPLLLALGRAAEPERGGLRFADYDLRAAGWSGALALGRSADAAVSTTALHWLSAGELAAVYGEVATVLRPGGLLLNGDHLQEDDQTAPVLARLGRALCEREDLRRFPGGHAESWAGWWEAVQADPALAGPVAERERRRYSADHHGSESNLLATHEAALRAAGFTEVGTLWQRGDNRLLCAVREAGRGEPWGVKQGNEAGKTGGQDRSRAAESPHESSHPVRVHRYGRSGEARGVLAVGAGVAPYVRGGRRGRAGAAGGQPRGRGGAGSALPARSRGQSG